MNTQSTEMFDTVNGMPKAHFKLFNGELFNDSHLSKYGVYRMSGDICVAIRIDLMTNSYRELFIGTVEQCLEHLAILHKNKN